MILGIFKWEKVEMKSNIAVYNVVFFVFLFFFFLKVSFFGGEIVFYFFFDSLQNSFHTGRIYCKKLVQFSVCVANWTSCGQSLSSC